MTKVEFQTQPMLLYRFIQLSLPYGWNYLWCYSLLFCCRI